MSLRVVVDKGWWGGGGWLFSAVISSLSKISSNIKNNNIELNRINNNNNNGGKINCIDDDIDETNAPNIGVTANPAYWSDASLDTAFVLFSNTTFSET